MSVKTEVKDAAKKSGTFDLIIVLLQAVAIAVVIRIFLFQPFNIPSGSMIPTLLIGDYLFVSKFSYGYSKHSFPLGFNLFSGRVFGSEPTRGDVVVFKTPRDNSTDFIKRLIGMPGERVQMRGGLVYINDKPLERRRVEDIVMDTKCGPNQSVRQYDEITPEGRVYRTQKLSETCKYRGVSSGADDTEVFVVPPGNYFFVGDNRDDSADSRFSIAENGVGFVPHENLVGRARILFFSIDESASYFAPWRWPAEIRWSRILNAIR